MRNEASSRFENDSIKKNSIKENNKLRTYGLADKPSKDVLSSRDKAVEKTQERERIMITEKTETTKPKRGRPKGKSNDKRSFGPLGDLIRKKRLDRNLGLSDVAKAVKCSVQFISNIEHGRAPLPWDKAQRLSGYLDIPMEDLQSANLSIRADFQSFVATSRGKKVSKDKTVLANVKDASLVLAKSQTDSTIADLMRIFQSASPTARKKILVEAKKIAETYPV